MKSFAIGRSLRLSTRCDAAPKQEAPKYPIDEAPKPWADPTKNPRFNVIPKSRWATGVPAVMGGHLLPSGAVAPISQSTTSGTGAPFQFRYPSTEMEAEVLQFPDATAAAASLVDRIHAAYQAAVAAKGSFSIALPGGSVLKALPALRAKADIDWSKWHVFFVDERVVAHASSDSNVGAAKKIFLNETSIPAAQIHAIVEGVSAEQTAIAYEGALLSTPASVLPRNAQGLPVFDFMLLGMGPDAHIGSLFPNRAATAETERWVVGVTNSPKPPPARITLTLPVINAAKNIVFYVVGAEKAEALQRVLEVQSLPGALPAQLVRPSEGKLSWIVDLEACSQIHPDTWTDAKQYPRTTFGKE